MKRDQRKHISRQRRHSDIHITILVFEKWAIVGKNWDLHYTSPRQDIKVCLEVVSVGFLALNTLYSLKLNLRENE